MQEVTNKQYAKWVRDSRFYADSGTGSMSELLYVILGLAGEAGETAEVIKKVIRKHGAVHPNAMSVVDKHALLDELGDVLWYVQAILCVVDSDLEELMSYNVTKLTKRHGVSDGS